MNADQVVFEVRVAGATDWSSVSADAPGVIRKEITGLTPGTSYEVAVSYRVRGVVGDQIVLGPVTAGDLAIAGVVTSDDLTAVVDGLNATIAGPGRHHRRTSHDYRRPKRRDLDDLHPAFRRRNPLSLALSPSGDLDADARPCRPAGRPPCSARPAIRIPLDLTGGTFKAQIRLVPEAPNDALITLNNVTSGGDGIRLLTPIDTSGPVPLSTIQLQIGQAALEALPPAPSEKDAAEFAWDLLITPSGGTKARWLYGAFLVRNGVTR